MPNGKLYGVSQETIGNRLDIYEIDIAKATMDKIEIFALGASPLLQVGGAARIPRSVSSSSFIIGGIAGSQSRFQLWTVYLSDDRREMYRKSPFLDGSTSQTVNLADMSVTSNGEILVLFNNEHPSFAGQILICGDME